MASADNGTNDLGAPARCTKNCGFFGNPNTMGMCSKCYKDTLSAPPQALAPAAAAPKPVVMQSLSPVADASPSAAAPQIRVAETPSLATPAPVTPVRSGPAADLQPLPGPSVDNETPSVDMPVCPPDAPPADDEPEPKRQLNTSRCWSCNKKIGLLGFKCKCEFFFCAEHRYSDKHECAFDYKALGKEQLTNANPTICPSKLQSF